MLEVIFGIHCTKLFNATFSNLVASDCVQANTGACTIFWWQQSTKF